ncbi:MAG TPA: metallophosphoesterase, partial [Promineifilum sp.]
MLVMGDIHGQIAKLRLTLRRAGIVDEQDHWIAGNATMWFLGDFFDRGPDGIAAVDLVRSLQREAAVAGGRVDALLGNHDILILAAQRFGTRPSGGPGGTFLSSWQLNGGV